MERQKFASFNDNLSQETILQYIGLGDENVQSKGSLRKLLELAGTHRVQLFWSCLFSVMSAALSLVPYLIVYQMTVALLTPPVDTGAVWTMVWIALGAVVLRFGLLAASTIISHTAAYRILYSLRIQLTNKLASLSLGYFSDRTSGKLKKIIAEDVERIENFIAHHLPDFASSLFTPLFTVIVLFAMDWRLALAALIPIPLAFFMQSTMFRGQGERMKEYHQTLEVMNSTILEYVRAMPIIKSYRMTVQSFVRYQDSVNQYTSFWIRTSRRLAPVYALFMVMIETGLLFILPVGIWLYTSGDVSLEILLLFLILGVGFTVPIKQISELGHMLKANMEGVNRIEDILQEDEIKEPVNALIPQRHDLEFANVHFSYGKQQVLHNVSFRAEEGTITAFVGPSGAGKTTAAQLIARFWDVSSGSICIGGVNLKDMKTEILMDRIAFVFQDVFMLNDSVLENIRLGRKEATDSEVYAAATAAQAHTFITELPDGYRTVIGDGGMHLSGGERQRISIARAILKNAPILILDEATAFADPENEAHIQDALSELLPGKTVVVIAHRLSTITDVDCIIVFEEGRIAGSGKHEELLQHCDTYRSLWKAYTAASVWVVGGKEASQHA
ncbi:ABC transporter ATP-binding protein/permease [Paenibacillus sp. ACRRX]|uniref:ABC transporter ATP-binding protein n=1 Tax=Paenibacillus sp. ACRRX TaxID=2918206 RepID=UPI001EF5FD82|nr:ABC transporter ATP-binding protein/permease [Paenibacillus sp. ACRRX]